MSKFTLVLAACVLAMGAWLMGRGTGYAIGYQQGKQSEASRRDADLVNQMTATLTAASGLTSQANAASQALRQSVGALEDGSLPLIKELNDALTQTAASRAGCVFSPGVMRQLQQAQQRSATAARQGLPGSSSAAVPATTTPTGKPRG